MFSFSINRAQIRFKALWSYPPIWDTSVLRKGDKMKYQRYTKEFKDNAVKLCLQPDANRQGKPTVLAA